MREKSTEIKANFLFPVSIERLLNKVWMVDSYPVIFFIRMIFFTRVLGQNVRKLIVMYTTYNTDLILV